MVLSAGGERIRFIASGRRLSSQLRDDGIHNRMSLARPPAILAGAGALHLARNTLGSDPLISVPAQPFEYGGENLHIDALVPRSPPELRMAGADFALDLLSRRERCPRPVGHWLDPRMHASRELFDTVCIVYRN